MNPPTYRGRFAPSPTGPLHFGSLVAAVGSYLEARSRGGAWLVRMEDLDKPRVAPGAANDILQMLDACGMEWDGAVVRQSRRIEAYHNALHALRLRGALYPCACSRREIADSAIAGIEGYVYPGTCRTDMPLGRRARAWRVRTHGVVEFDDAIQGPITQDVDSEIGDFVLYRADGTYAYQLAVVVDDAEQGITHVVRGADLLESTPRQIYLKTLLGLPEVRYAHLPVAVNARGEKLSKQTFAKAIARESAAESLANALRFLGHAPPALGDVRAIWEWAIENWRIQRVPRVRTAPA
ncbi:MAG: tRNA glutamyl-Q(34) synthetase GluQRS [Burkholderiales bacterium]